MKPIRILIAEDSDLFADVLSETIEAEPDMKVIGVASDGEKAVEMCGAERPDLILMDIQMPRMDGLTATRHIMGQTPTPILVITSDPYHGGVDMSFKALSAGALDLMAKPEGLPWPDSEYREFMRKVRLLSQIPVVRHMRGRRRAPVSFHGRPGEELEPDEIAILGIVASTGGPKAVARILGDLPPQFASPVLLVQHIMRGFSTHLSTWLDKNCALPVREASQGMKVEPGTVYVAPAELHMEFTSSGQLSLHDAPEIGGHRPSGDLMLESLARHAQSRAIGAVLSGMGSDGTVGLSAIKRTGGTTLVQDRESAVVYSMPQSAIDLGVVDEIVELDNFARRLVKISERIQRST